METKTEATPLLQTAPSSSSSSSSSSSTTSSIFSYYNPFYCFEVAIRSFLKCLGLGSSSAKEQEQDQEEEVEVEEEKNNQSCTQDVDVGVDPPPTSTDETGNQQTEDAGINVVDPRGRSRVRFPTRPHISRGRPGQINSTSPT